jgi:hypothetical protein
LTAEQQLIVLSAGTEERRLAMREAIEARIARADWSRLSELLGGQRLLPTLGPRILELAEDRASEEFRDGVIASVEAACRQDTLLGLVSTRAEGALANAGIRSAALKGPALGERLYGEPGRRLSSDVDLLVPAGRLNDAVEVARGLGYAEPEDHVEGDGLPLLHFALVHERGKLPPVELHWRVHWYESRFASDRLLPPGGGGGWRPEPVDELTALLLFYARDGFTGLRQAVDLGAWWDAFGSDLPAGALAGQARSYPALRPALSAALAVAGRTVGLSIRRTGGEGPSLGARGRLAVRLADTRPYRSEAQLFAEIGLIDGLLTPPRGLWAFVRRQVAPPREVIREHERGGRSNSTLGYCVRVLGRYGLAIARLLGIPGAKRSRFAS